VIDSHCHLADPAFAGDLDAVVLRAREAGVSGALCVVGLGNDDEARQAVAVHHLWPALRFAVGLHPHEAKAYAGRAERLADALDAAWRTADHEAGGYDPCAVGEIGLDYHYDLSPRDVQRDVFRAQVRYARERRLPIIIHTREADEDTLGILSEEGSGGFSRITESSYDFVIRENPPDPCPGVFHCFSGSADLARAALNLGFHLSFSGIVTFPRAGTLRDIAAAAPVDRLLVETDCPYLAPVPHRGKRNEPAWVMATAAAVATARGMSLADFDRVTTANFERLFGGSSR
jgi:TatD DNase family protein